MRGVATSTRSVGRSREKHCRSCWTWTKVQPASTSQGTCTRDRTSRASIRHEAEASLQVDPDAPVHGGGPLCWRRSRRAVALTTCRRGPHDDIGLGWARRSSAIERCVRRPSGSGSSARSASRPTPTGVVGFGRFTNSSEGLWERSRDSSRSACPTTQLPTPPLAALRCRGWGRGSPRSRGCTCRDGSRPGHVDDAV